MRETAKVKGVARRMLTVLIAVFVLFGMSMCVVNDPIYATSSEYKPYVGKWFVSHGGVAGYRVKLTSLSKKRIKGKIVVINESVKKGERKTIKFNKKIKMKKDGCKFTVKRSDGTKVKVKLKFKKDYDEMTLQYVIATKTSSKQDSFWNIVQQNAV